MSDTSNKIFVPNNENELREIVAHRLRKEREKKEMSQKKLSELTGLSPKQLLRIERCDPEHPEHWKQPDYKVMVSFTSLIRICNALEIPLTQILYDR